MITSAVYFFENQSTTGVSNSLYNVNDGTLILQVDGEASKLELSVLGTTTLTNDDFVNLKVSDVSDYSTVDTITSNGIYWIDINGIRKIKLNLTDITGTINVKGITKSGLTTDLVAMAAKIQDETDPTVPDYIKSIKEEDINKRNSSGGEIPIYYYDGDITSEANKTIFENLYDKINALIMNLMKIWLDMMQVKHKFLKIQMVH